MPSFDVVSKIDHNEIKNAINQAEKEVAQRFDFKDTNTRYELVEKGIMIHSATEDRVRAAHEVLTTRLVRRGVNLKSVEAQKIEPAGGGTAKQMILLREGIDQDRAKKLNKYIKDLNLKVQSQIQGDAVRITGKKKDDLQEVIGHLKAMEFDVPLQFINFRD
ncbi:MAG: hypothetical protein GMKNLPBB_00084 [Myxococcota bacterium]|nr:hypothetical protein [Myxococcota bacterium]